MHLFPRYLPTARTLDRRRRRRLVRQAAGRALAWLTPSADPWLIRSDYEAGMVVTSMTGRGSHESLQGHHARHGGLIRRMGGALDRLGETAPSGLVPGCAGHFGLRGSIRR